MTVLIDEKANDEISRMVEEMVDEIVGYLGEMIPQVDLTPKISDAKIRDAVIRMAPDGWAKLYKQFGMKAVIDFVNQYAPKREVML